MSARVLQFPAPTPGERMRRPRRLAEHHLCAPPGCVISEWNVTDGHSAFIGRDLQGNELVRVVLPNKAFTGLEGMHWAGAIHRYLAEECGVLAAPALKVVR